MDSRTRLSTFASWYAHELRAHEAKRMSGEVTFNEVVLEYKNGCLRGCTILSPTIGEIEAFLRGHNITDDQLRLTMELIRRKLARRMEYRDQIVRQGRTTIRIRNGELKSLCTTAPDVDSVATLQAWLLAERSPLLLPVS